MPAQASRLPTLARCLLRQLQAFLPRLTGRREAQHIGPGLILQNNTGEGYTVTSLKTLCGRPLGKREPS